MKTKLGKLPSSAMVRITLAIPEALMQQLDRYAQFHSVSWDQAADPRQIACQILAKFLATDRGFQQAEREHRKNSEKPKSP